MSGRQYLGHLIASISSYCITEDVLGERSAVSWSPDSQYFIFAEFNDTGVPTQSWPLYGDPDDVYLRHVTIAYPKVSCAIYRPCKL